MAGERAAPIADVLPAVRRVGAAVLDLLLPRRCISCGGTVEGAGALCPECWSRITFLGPPLCFVCGYPFPYDAGEGALCAACTARHPDYDRARSIFAYDAASRGPVLAFKHADRTDAGPTFGRMLMRAGSDLLAGAELIVPVPLHRRRLMVRRYNQAAELARALAAIARVPAAPDLLLRTRRTPSQGGLSARGRRRNVRGAFAVRPGRAGGVRDRHILVVDDVFTTGATVEACARTLRAAGAATVDILTLARVVRPGGL